MVRVKTILGVLFLVAASQVFVASARADSPSDAIRVMTWNVKTGPQNRTDLITFGPQNWKKVIGNQRPDIVALQEICVDNVEVSTLVKELKKSYGLEYRYVQAAMSTKAYCGLNIGDGGRNYGLAILSRYEADDEERVRYPENGLDGERRGYLAATYHLPGGEDVRVFTTHITNKPKKGDENPQRDQVQIISDAAEQYDNVLVMGDFNLLPEDSELAIMRERFDEVDEVNNSATSGNDPSKRDDPAAHKIDHIFSRNFPPVDVPQTYWTASSDHRPLVADVGNTTIIGNRLRDPGYESGDDAWTWYRVLDSENDGHVRCSSGGGYFSDCFFQLNRNGRPQASVAQDVDLNVGAGETVIADAVVRCAINQPDCVAELAVWGSPGSSFEETRSTRCVIPADGRWYEIRLDRDHGGFAWGGGPFTSDHKTVRWELYNRSGPETDLDMDWSRLTISGADAPYTVPGRLCS